MQAQLEFCKQYESADLTLEFLMGYKNTIETFGSPVPCVTEMLGEEAQRQIWAAHALVAYATLRTRAKNSRPLSTNASLLHF